MNISLFRNEIQQELSAILEYWMQHAIDEEQGGFYGRIDNDNICYADAPKGCVLNARILWTFSAAASLTNDWRYAKAPTWLLLISAIILLIRYMVAFTGV
jgi:cellobiose epimerase